MFDDFFDRMSEEYAEVAAVQPGRMPDVVLVARSDKKIIKVNKFQDSIWGYHYLQMNYGDTINSIVIDVDSILCIEALIRQLPDGLRPASITGIISPCSRKFIRPHIRFNLKCPVRKNDSKAFNRLKAVTNTMQAVIAKTGADVDPATPPHW